MSIEFVDQPPADGRVKHDHEAIASALRERPGQWALVFKDESSPTATRINRGFFSAYRPAGAFEAIRRRGNGGRTDVYARYVGEAGER